MVEWEKSDLKVGEEVKLPQELFISDKQARILKARYIGETHAGLMIECEFMPSTDSEYSRSYRTFISWNQIWCGAVTIKADGCPIRARRKDGVFIGE